MSAPPPFVPPPLPPSWTEHTAPGGQTYYHNASTQQSTYTRPLPSMSFALPFMPPGGAVVPGVKPPKKKKERPMVKTLVPDTAWLRVKTTEGNVFWTHKERKESVWVVPDEIREQAEAMEKAEAEAEVRATERGKEEARERERQLERDEVQRVVGEVKGAVAAGKRKAVEPAEKGLAAGNKKARVEDEQEEDEDWQREVADEMVTEAAREDPAEDDAGPLPTEDAQDAPNDPADADHAPAAPDPTTPALTLPTRVDLSLDEAKALFKTLLREKDINPLHPWDTSLPLFIADPRYVLLPSVSARREAFDEYCRDAARARRQAREKEQTQVHDAGDTAKAAYARLLREEATSTRTTWTEFRRAWKKDRRFFGWAGDRERERAFREWMRGLGEVKRQRALEAERGFFQLLREHKDITLDGAWKEVKRRIDPKDPRYDAVGSSSLREELFTTYVKTLGADAQADDADDDKTTADARRKERAERGLREREEKVRRERAGVERELGRTRGAVGREEAEREFTTLLTDAVRDAQATWDTTAPALTHDPRYAHSPLPPSTQRTLFDAHVAHLRAKHLAALHTLFAAHAPALNTPWADLPASMRASVPAVRLGLADDGAGLREAFERWQRGWGTDARKAFDAMLGESAFLEFWGRTRKAGEGGGGAAGVVPDVEEEEQDGEGGGGRADLRKLARGVDVAEVGTVLKGDARWTAFDHVPEERERWLREHMERLAAPKLSVHVPDKAA